MAFWRRSWRNPAALSAVSAAAAVAVLVWTATELDSPDFGPLHVSQAESLDAADLSVQASGAPAPSAATAPQQVDRAWAQRVSQATQIPERAVMAYASADLTIRAEDPGCDLGWNTLAGIGEVESDHGRHAGSSINAQGVVTPAVLGPVLDGHVANNAAIGDTDRGRFDADPLWDRAVGPMQFLPSTWAKWGADGNGDGRADPQQIDDAALTAARYLCASGPLSSPERWRAAVSSYNHSSVYVDNVATWANTYARLAH